MTANPRLMALAYRVWCYADPLGWNCTASEIAAALGVTHQQVGHVLRIKGWTGKTRVALTDFTGSTRNAMTVADQDAILSRYADD